MGEWEQGARKNGRIGEEKIGIVSKLAHLFFGRHQIELIMQFPINLPNKFAQ
jgi:hypothetical protein